LALNNFVWCFIFSWQQDQLALRCVLTAVDKQQRLPVRGSLHALHWLLLVLEHLPDVPHGTLHRGLTVSAL